MKGPFSLLLLCLLSTLIAANRPDYRQTSYSNRQQQYPEVIQPQRQTYSHSVSVPTKDYGAHPLIYANTQVAPSSYHPPSPHHQSYKSPSRCDQDDDDDCPGNVVYTWASGCAYSSNITGLATVGVIYTTRDIDACAASCQALGPFTCNTFTYVPLYGVCALFSQSPLPGVAPLIIDPLGNDPVAQCGYIGSLPGPSTALIWTSVPIEPIGENNPIYSYHHHHHHEEKLKGTLYSWANECDYRNITAVTAIGVILSLSREKCAAVCLANHPQCNTFTYDLSTSKICTLENQTPPVAPGVRPDIAAPSTQCGYIGKAAKGPGGFKWNEGSIAYCPKEIKGQQTAASQITLAANGPVIQAELTTLFSNQLILLP